MSRTVADFMRCMGQCKKACSYYSLDMRISTAIFPAPAKVTAFTTYLNRAFNESGLNFTDEETRQLSLFEMYYETEELQVIEKITRTSIDELISNIGGAMGVWTGLSLLSVYQCIVYMMKASWGFCVSRIRVTRVQSIRNQ